MKKNDGANSTLHLRTIKAITTRVEYRWMCALLTH